MTGGWLRGRLERRSDTDSWLVVLADGKRKTISKRRVQQLRLGSGDGLMVQLDSGGSISDARAATATASAADGGQQPPTATPTPPPPAAAPAGSAARFINPYNFVPFSGPPSDNPPGLRPAQPAGHDRLHSDLLSGTIDVELTVVTPLLLVDQSRAGTVGGHKTLPPRIGPDGRPLLAASSVRGALRSAYEAVTNSAYGVIDRRWQRPLAMRDPARNALEVRFAKVSADGQQLLLQPDLKALLPVDWNHHDRNAPLLPDPWLPITPGSPGHLGKQQVALELWYHCPRRTTGRPTRGYYFWRSPGAPEPTTFRKGKTQLSHSPHGCVLGCTWKVAGVQPLAVECTARVTGTPRIAGTRSNKHDERLFVDSVPGASITHDTVPVTDAMRTAWEGVIDSYAAGHKPADVRSGGYPPYVGKPQQWRALKPGDLVFAKKAETGVWVLRPAMISRVPFRTAPAMLADGHLPAGGIGGLTAAERVFGWVGGTGSYAGHVVVEPPACTADDWSGRGEDAEPLELAPLNSPKPSYYRFYVESPGSEEKSQDRGYVAGARLRGWKVYPHHRVLEGAASEAVEQAVRVARYQDAKGVEHPNRRVTFSVRDWVKAGATFSVRLRFTNLTGVELGALLWVLDPDGENGGLLRLGLGKPLGMGSLRSKVNGTSIWRGAGRWTFSNEAAPEAAESRAAFEQAVGNHPLRKALEAHLAASQGWGGVASHYPRVLPAGATGPAPPAQPGYLWFVENERQSRREALPDLDRWPAPSLPVWQVSAPPHKPGT